MLLLFIFLSCNSSSELPEHSWQGQTMGTTYQVKIVARSISQDTLRLIKQKIDRELKVVNQQMSTYDPESEISQFNSLNDTTAFKVSPQFVNVVRQALKVYHDSQGAFDITVAPLVELWGFGRKKQIIKIPDEKVIKQTVERIGSDKLIVVDDQHLKKKTPQLKIDLSAIAKGYGVDVVASIIANHGFKNYMVEIGGEIVAHGVNAKSEAWKIGIDRPELDILPGQALEGVLTLNNIAAATSGDYRNYHMINGKIYSHTIDPKTGRPVTHNLASVTVIAGNCMLADALATAVMVLGKEKGLPWIENIPDVEAMFITRNDDNTFKEILTSGFENYLLTQN